MSSPSRKRIKVIVVLDCEYLEEWENRGYTPPQVERITPDDIRDNLPDYVASEICGGLLGSGQGESFYRLSDPTVYVSLNDFDMDRAMQIDHFAVSPGVEQ